MEETRISETLENILDKIDETLDNLERGNEAIISAAVFTLARAYDMLAQYDASGYEDGELE
jgi:hypothetical protein